MEEKTKKVKGEKHGLCNRSACQTPEDVVFYNKGTRKFYCPVCADLINNANKDHPDTVRVIGERFLCRTEEGLLPGEFRAQDLLGLSTEEIIRRRNPDFLVKG